MEPQQNNTIKKGAIGILTIGLIAGLGLYLSQEKNKSNESAEITTTEEAGEPTTPPQTTGTQNPPQNTEVSTTVTVGSTYKDGVYKASGTYTSPAGKETVAISLTLANDVVTAATFKGDATNPGSKNWQGKFSEGFTQVVVGKKIEDISLTVVNGSSLTPKGFTDALSKVKAEAKI